LSFHGGIAVLRAKSMLFARPGSTLPRSNVFFIANICSRVRFWSGLNVLSGKPTE